MQQFISFAISLQVLLFSEFAVAELEVKWFGATCVSISDGTTTLLVDPFFTRPSLWDVVSFKSLKSDPMTIKKWLPSSELNKISTLVTSHSHYDHALDLVEVSKLTDSQIYGSNSARNIALGGGVSSEKVNVIKAQGSFKSGQFKIKVLKGDHPPHFLNLTLAAGYIKKPLKPGASAYAYKKGEDFSFLISHPEGKILFHPSGNSILNKKDLEGFNADLILLGIANRRSTQELIDKVVGPSKDALVVPVHHDNIFTALSDNPKYLFGVDMSEFRSTVKRNGLKLRELKIGESLRM